MKKLITLFVLVFAFTVNAQEKRFNPKEEAKKDVAQMQLLLNLNATNTENFLRLLELKYQYLNENLSEERKLALKESIDAKLRATLSNEEMSLLESKNELYKKLIN
jgi:hypothetical protein